jgi:hypothetical protein
MSGDGVGFFFLTATDQLEEQIGADSIDRQIIDFIDESVERLGAQIASTRRTRAILSCHTWGVLLCR